jgi:hypothetical protein
MKKQKKRCIISKDESLLKIESTEFENRLKLTVWTITKKKKTWKLV